MNTRSSRRAALHPLRRRCSSMAAPAPHAPSGPSTRCSAPSAWVRPACAAPAAALPRAPRRCRRACRRICARGKPCPPPLASPHAPAAGFPEHVSHAKQALAAGYNIVVMDPSDTRHLCWSSTNNDGWTNDQPRVRAPCASLAGSSGGGSGWAPGCAGWLGAGPWLAQDRGRAEPQPAPAPLPPPSPQVIGTLMQLLQRRGLNSRPVYLWGASSGGTLALKMPLWLDKYRAWAAGQAAAGVQVPPVFSVAGIISGGWPCLGGGAWVRKWRCGR